MESAVKKLKRVESYELNLSSESDSAAEEDEKGTQRASHRQQVTNRVVAKAGMRNVTSKTQKKTRARVMSTAESAAVTCTSSATSAPAALAESVPLNQPSSKRAVALTKPAVIPQRVQAESDKLKNKQKAIEIFQKRIRGGKK